MPEKFHIALTADFLDAEGRPVMWEGELGPLHAAAERASYSFFDTHLPEIAPDQVAEADAVICLTPRVTGRTVAGASRLKVIARWGVGYDTVDVAACTEADVAVTITKGAVNHPVAEAIIAFMLALGHHLFTKDRLVRQARWDDRTNFNGSELREKVAGIVGLGGIGSTTLKLLTSFGMAQPIASDPYLGAEAFAAAGARSVDLDTLLAEADYVILTCPLTEETRNLIGAAQLARMKSHAYLINTARGGIVNEAALVQALQSRRIAGAALDVFEKEPSDASNPFIGLDNIILSPHAIAWTDELFRDVGEMACQSILDLAAGKQPHGLLNPEVWDRPGFRKKMGLD